MGKNSFLTQMIVVLLIVLLVGAGTVSANTLGSRILNRGMSGYDVIELQKFLNEHGYNAGPEDGYFGKLTYSSILRFQRHQNLPVDGIVSTEVFELMRVLANSDKEEMITVTSTTVPVEFVSDKPALNFSPDELDLFARLVHSEAAGEPFQGQVAVAASILNRLSSPLYPDTMKEVVYQVSNGYYQYSPVLDGRINSPAGDSARKAVQEAIAGSDPSGGATGFYNPSKTWNQWVRSQPVTVTIGNHVFFK